MIENSILWQRWFVLLSIPLLLTFLIMNIVPAAQAFVVLASAYLILDIVSVNDFLQGFTNNALMTLILLMLCSQAIERSLLIQYLSRKIMDTNEETTFIRLISISAILSAFVNNTVVAATFLGAISRQSKILPSRLLIPLSYATILGGVTTLIGTSTNLVVNSFIVKAGLPPLTMFSFSAVGVPVAAICLFVLYRRRDKLPALPFDVETEIATYFLTVQVEKQSKLTGKTVFSSGIEDFDGLHLLEIIRDGRLISPVHHSEIVMPADKLIFTGSIDNVKALQQFEHLTLLGGKASELLKSNLVEAVVSNESELLYKTLEAQDFNNRFHAGVVGIRRGNKCLTGQLNKIPLRVGDTLLLAAADTFFRQRTNDRNFHILGTTRQVAQKSLSKNRSIFVIAAFLLTIFASVFHLLSLFKGLLILLGLFLLTKCVDIADLRRRFPFDLFLIIGSALVISDALTQTGASAVVGSVMLTISSGNHPFVALCLIFFLTMLLTETVTNNAAAALSVPLALQAANALNVSYEPFVMAVAFGASACFLLPFGYQTHLMVYTPGNYRVKDFLRIGWVVSICYGLLVLLLITLLFPFAS